MSVNVLDMELVIIVFLWFNDVVGGGGVVLVGRECYSGW